MEPLRDTPELHPWVTPSIQGRTLSRVIHEVQAAALRGERPVVEVDLDLCAVRPILRTRKALKTVGDYFQLGEFSTDQTLPLLPGYSDEAWHQFILSMELEQRHPELEWTCEGRPSRRPGTPFALFHAHYWELGGLQEDSPTPGLGSFVHRIETSGGQVVFLSGRWLPEHESPTLATLRRAGIPNPNLIIGNPWHETLVHDRSDAVSDSAIKAWRQAEIARRFGRPVAIIDDRQGNRSAVQSSNSHDILGIAIAIPGFTCDPVTASVPLRISTFESFDETILSGPPRRHLRTRYPGLGLGRPWNGLYEGLGRNSRSYVLPRFAAYNRATPTPYVELIKKHPTGSLAEEDFLDLCQQQIPEDTVALFTAAMNSAKALSDQGLADAYPPSTREEDTLRRTLIAAWLHSRDIETVLSALGYTIEATGVHDLVEFVDASEIIHLLRPKSPPDKAAASKRPYSPWILRWAETLSPGQRINVGLLNPALLVSFSRWSPTQTGPQDAMDVHRLSDHHEGDQAERYDPVEATVNNLLHQREGRHGVRKEAVAEWSKIRESLVRETGAESLAKSSIGRDIIRDAAQIAQGLERNGFLTPWALVTGASFD